MSRIESTIAMYKAISVFPEFSTCTKKHQLASEAPLIEDDDGKVAFVNSGLRKEWLNRFYAKEQRERNRNGKK